MRIASLKLFSLLAAVGLSVLSCAPAVSPVLVVEKASPSGTYRVRMEYRRNEHEGEYGSTEYLKVRFFKGQELIHADDWEEDAPDVSLSPVEGGVEWVAENVLRDGETWSGQPFNDEVVVTNSTGEDIKYARITYGRTETFQVFELAPGRQVTLRTSPGFIPSGPSRNFWLGYDGVTQSGKKFVGSMPGKERKSPAEGPLKYAVDISVK
jgi:hypothetical protein